MNIIKKFFAGTAAILLSSSLFAGAAFAAGTDHFGPFNSTSPDNGTCGSWATDAFDRFFSVHDNGDGTFNVTEDFKNGSFVTTGPNSPGCGEAGPNHGLTVSLGINGNMQGSESGTVASTTYNANGCAVPASCNTTAGFIASVFDTGASFDVTTWNFEYNSSDQSLKYHHWQDKSDKQIGEQFIGDIAN